MSDKPVYVIAGSDGRTWFYLVPKVDEYDVTWSADGEPMTCVPHKRYYWWSHPGLAAELMATGHPRRGTLLHYRLDDEANVSERYPVTLTVEEWAARGGGDSDVYQALYSAVWEKLEPRRWVFPASGFVDLGVGAPPADDGRTWVADLPRDLEYRPDLHHLFPGRLTGFRAHMRQVLDAISGVDAYDSSGFVVYVKLRFDPPELHPVNRGRYPSKSESTLTKEIRPNIPRDVLGANRAEACRRWDELTEHWVALFRDFATVKVCGACQGRGVATPKLGGGEPS